ncbi:hypothetical protein WJ96_04755 [Burkholderia ubonensis]|uniref:Uncharacterized protein n=1 Tax=Burkholderia ubonensis TaxID=101571 RepID=A0AAW3MX41_9BURK|nr:hypothetical protein [Burkholderia ubonensis]KVP75078.1 hypothetical protein WJ93_06595 [Burkholderia ubonensis]KVP97883.1 hypothetical protein WJ96_04755 [Burkholderia ubonensis]KVZ92580.1 hypothetical protein WL25_16410 [Burkholderia ubonensis]
MAKVDVEDLGYNQIPHYCTHAIDFFAELANWMPQRLGIPADFELLLCELMRDSIKFLLPDNGYLFADHDFRPAMFDLLRLPYPVCALEFTATPELYAAHSGLAYSAKRIALCFDPRQLPPAQISRFSRLCGKPFLDSVPERCLAVMAVYEANGTWSAAVGVVLIDLDEDKPMPLKGEIPEELRVVAERIGERLKSKKTVHGLPATFLTFPGRSRLVGQTVDEATEALYIDTIDEMRTAYEFLAAINCSNVGTQDVPAPKLLNDRRKKKGRALFYPYKVLDLSPATAPGERGEGGGIHASPRTHLRRGHIRQLGERFGYKVLWINATVVNAKPGAEPVSTVYKVRA